MGGDAGQATPGRKPALRGWLHVVAFFGAWAAGLYLYARAAGPEASLAAACFSIATVLVFGISGFYHAPTWQPATRAKIRKFDHLGIYFMILGSAVPISLWAVGGTPGLIMLTLVILGSIGGAIRAFAWPNAPKAFRSLVYFCVGAAMLPSVPITLVRGDTALAFWLLAGGVFYAAGAVIYSRRKPDPFPTVFGYHEIFHLFVIAAACCHYVAVWRMLT